MCENTVTEFFREGGGMCRSISQETCRLLVREYDSESRVLDCADYEVDSPLVCIYMQIAGFLLYRLLLSVHRI